MAGWAAGKGKGKVSYGMDPDYGIPGLNDALTETLMLLVDLDPSGNLEEMKGKCAQKIVKAANKFALDERLTVAGGATQAKALIEEFVETVMGALSAGLYDKEWFGNANFTGPLLAATLYAFNGAKIFRRVLQPRIEQYVEGGVFLWNEEERIRKGVWDAVEANVKESHRKKANSHLVKAYDEAHLKAPFGSTTADSTEMGLLQDFVRGWMVEFVNRGWDILENGIGSGKAASRDEQVLFLTVLFQTLTDPGNACLPHDLVSQIPTPPPSPWPYIASCAEAVFDEVNASSEQAPKRFKGGGKFGGKGW